MLVYLKTVYFRSIWTPHASAQCLQMLDFQYIFSEWKKVPKFVLDIINEK